VAPPSAAPPAATPPGITESAEERVAKPEPESPEGIAKSEAEAEERIAEAEPQPESTVAESSVAPPTVAETTIIQAIARIPIAIVGIPIAESVVRKTQAEAEGAAQYTTITKSAVVQPSIAISVVAQPSVAVLNRGGVVRVTI